MMHWVGRWASINLSWHLASLRSFRQSGRKCPSDMRGLKIGSPSLIEDLENGSAKLRRKLGRAVLSTLKPEHLLPADFVDMSNKITQTISFGGMSHVPAGEGGGVIAKRAQLYFGSRDRRFPDHARGFLYLHQDLNEPMKSSIRLRCIQSNDPATFDQGKDLIRRSGQPWALPMSTILHSRSSYIRNYLLHVGILTDHQIIRWKSSLKYPSPKGPPRYCPVLSTLKPDELLPSDFVDLSHKSSEMISFIGVPAPEKAKLRYCPNDARFPDHARGFLYYYQHMNMPPIAASIRLRCTSSNDPATFGQGKDLLNPIGLLPWEVKMPAILSIRSPQFRDYLLRARIVTEAQMILWKHMHMLNGKITCPRHAIYRLDQPFLVKFHSSSSHLVTVVRDFIGHLQLGHIFHDRRRQYKIPPYRGSAFARFELSMLPEHLKDRIIVMRILKFVEPVTCVIPNYDGRLQIPREGELFYQQQLFTRRIDADSPTSQCLKHLVEDYLTSPMPAPPHIG